MKIIVGLGNPGPAYENTRHNAGFWILDNIARRFGFEFSRRKFDALFASGRFGEETVVLIKPMVFMNRSGRSVSAAVSFYGLDLEDVLVIHDDVDLEPGRLKIRKGGGHAGHKGVRSILEDLGDGGFFRLRFGVGRPEDPRIDTSDFVLAKISPEEREPFWDWSDSAAKAAICLLEEGLASAQNRFHAK